VTDREFKKEILGYFKKHGRTHLPWRQTTDPYKIMVSEIMLQQTQVDRVIPKYQVFLKAFPTAKKLALATNTEVLALWSGLGYNRRALNLKRAAEMVVGELKAKFPTTKDELDTLPGIGPYTAGAIAAFAYNSPEVFIETNIRAVYIHYFFIDKTKVDDSELLPIIERTVDRTNPRQWYSALMDRGSALKKEFPNPSRRSKQHSVQTKFEGSVRQVRGAILKLLLEKKKVTLVEIKKLFDDERYKSAIASMMAEGMIKKEGKYFFLS
jgi:A/G-specific adenine glycosylase